MGICYSLDTDTNHCSHQNKQVRIVCCDKKPCYIGGYQPYNNTSSIPTYYTGKPPPPYNPNS